MALTNRVVFLVEANQNNQLIRDFLKFRGISDRALKKLRNNGKILCNGVEVTWRRVVHTGDEVVLVYPPAKTSTYLRPEPIELSIVYEDNDIVLVNKQPGICVHPTKAYPAGTLANGLLFHWLQSSQTASFHAVNRIDRNTSGLVLVAKNSFSAQRLFLQRQQLRLTRSYVALVHGQVQDSQTRVDLPIEKCEGKTTKRCISESGQRAVTNFEVLAHFTKYTLIRLFPETGRTHQIRVHLAHLGHPLVGDELYGGSTGKIKRHCLHADRISFFHPRTGEVMLFQIPLPQDIASVIPPTYQFDR